MLARIQGAVRFVFDRAEVVFDAAFGPRLNPFHHLGALGFFFFWIVAASGIYLYVFFETSIHGAYHSIERLTHEQWYLGGIMRSLHRYGSDAMVIVVLLHLAREFARDRYRGVRWYPWITGAVLLWFLYASGISGYWLVWDTLAQYIAVATSEWLDALPIFGEPIARNFLDQTAVSDRFFSLMIFLHIAIPLFLLLGMWIHIQRISRARTNPPRGLVAGSLAALVALALVYPALSQAPANLDQVVSTVPLDWYYLAVYPLLDIWSPAAVWVLLGGGTLLLVLLPWSPPARQEAAVVSLANCNGCARCFADCPYNAVIMQPRTDGRPFDKQAVVETAQCTGCGICVGACPSATPFRRATALVPGIDLPGLPVQELRARTLAAAARLVGEARVLVYGCRDGPDLAYLDGHGVAALTLPCIGMLPPSFIDFVISRGHADGVLLAGCKPEDCQHRFGVTWTEQRLARARDPYLRTRVPRVRVGVCWAGHRGRPQLERELAALRAQLRLLGPYRRTESAAHTVPRSQEIRHAADRVG